MTEQVETEPTLFAGMRIAFAFPFIEMNTQRIKILFHAFDRNINKFTPAPCVFRITILKLTRCLTR